ncbi:MAG TPA: MarR family transcriptional regulator [Jatrophihabitantaceae bacterium]
MTQLDPEADEATLSEALFAAIGVLRREARRAAGGRPWPLESLGGSQLELLRLIRRQPGVSVAEAATELGLAANSVSTLVGQLNEAGLIRRSPDPADRRVARLTLTGTARRHTEAWRDRRSAVAESAIAQLSAADRARLTDALPVLGRITDALRVAAKPPKE